MDWIFARVKKEKIKVFTGRIEKKLNWELTCKSISMEWKRLINEDIRTYAICVNCWDELENWQKLLYNVQSKGTKLNGFNLFIYKCQEKKMKKVLPKTFKEIVVEKEVKECKI